MDAEHRIKLFGMSLGLTESDLDKVEVTMAIDLQRSRPDQKDETYYPQFEQELRVEASRMGQHYELFYCLERSIRRLAAETLEAEHGQRWWDNCVPEAIRQKVAAGIKREVDSAVTLRSEDEIDFTTFGELGEIVRGNWTSFGAIFSSEKAFSSIMTSLNILRGPIAHCCPLAEDEVLRLQLTVRDWFRLME